MAPGLNAGTFDGTFELFLTPKVGEIAELWLNRLGKESIRVAEIRVNVSKWDFSKDSVPDSVYAIIGQPYSRSTSRRVDGKWKNVIHNVDDLPEFLEGLSLQLSAWL